MIIDTSNALAAPGSSRGYACLSVACRSIASPGVPCAPGCARGWGFPRRAPFPGPSVPLSVDDGVCAPAPLARGGRDPEATVFSLSGASSRRTRPTGKKGLGSRGPAVLTGSPSPLWPCRGCGSRRGRVVRGVAPRGRVPRRWPAGRRGVLRRCALLPPGCGRAASRARGACVGVGSRAAVPPPRDPGRRPPVLPPARAPVRPPASSPRPCPPGNTARPRGRRGVSAVVSRVCWRVRVLSPASPVGGKALSPRRARARPFRDATSDQTWRPAEFKHISQRRKRN